MVTRETLVLLDDSVKNYRSASLLAYKQSLLVSGRPKARVASTQVARDQVAKKGWPEALWSEVLCVVREPRLQKKSPLF